MKNKQSLKYQGMWEKETCKSSFHFELVFLSILFRSIHVAAYGADIIYKTVR